MNFERKVTIFQLHIFSFFFICSYLTLWNVGLKLINDNECLITKAMLRINANIHFNTHRLHLFCYKSSLYFLTQQQFHFNEKAKLPSFLNRIWKGMKRNIMKQRTEKNKKKFLCGFFSFDLFLSSLICTWCFAFTTESALTLHFCSWLRAIFQVTWMPI